MSKRRRGQRTSTYEAIQVILNEDILPHVDQSATLPMHQAECVIHPTDGPDGDRRDRAGCSRVGHQAHMLGLKLALPQKKGPALCVQTVFFSPFFRTDVASCV